jgi:hypothetical protein
MSDSECSDECLELKPEDEFLDGDVVSRYLESLCQVGLKVPGNVLAAAQRLRREEWDRIKPKKDRSVA